MQKIISQIQTEVYCASSNRIIHLIKIIFAKVERLSKASFLKLVKNNEEDWATEIRRAALKICC